MTTKATLRRRIQRAVADDSIDPEEFDSWIVSATVKINQVLRVSEMLTRASIPLTKTLFATPPGFLAVKSLRLQPGDRDLSVTSPQMLAEEKEYIRSSGGFLPTLPKLYSVYGDEIEFSSFSDTSGAIKIDLRYYREAFALVNDTDTNSVLSKYPDLYFNAALIYAYRYTMEMDAADRVNSEFSTEVERLNTQRETEKYSNETALIIPPPAVRMGGRFS